MIWEVLWNVIPVLHSTGYTISYDLGGNVNMGGSPGGYTLGACSGFDSRISHKSAFD
jgi:hypothetical protein